MTRVIGLSGGIGSGKSTVARMLAGLGAVVIDADAIAHELQAPGTPVLAEIAREFGAEILLPDGSLDRPALARRVFADPEARRRLGEITHPAVGREMLRRLEAARAAGAPLVVMDNPLLFEGRVRRGEAERGEAILVYAPPETQVARQMARDGVTREFALQRMAAQLPIDAKRALATWVIDNGGSLAETERQVRQLIATLRS
jgi:dephospho-CoA kinase